jgi:uncharacterized DUF497 family protein
MALIWDEAKRKWTLRHRGIDFADAELVFAGDHFDRLDDRQEYGERRFVTAGWLRNASSCWFGQREETTVGLSA